MYDRAVDNFESDRWSVAANSFDRLLSRFPETRFTRDALAYATEATLRAGDGERATGRLLEFRDFIAREMLEEKKPETQSYLLVDLVKSYSNSDLQREGLDLMINLIPSDISPRDLGDSILETAEHVAFQLSDEALADIIAAHPEHVLIPSLRIHLARRALAAGDADRALALVSEINMHSLRGSDRSAIREIRSRTSGRRIIDGRVALLLPLTGSYSQYAQAVLKGVQLALHPSSDEIGRPLGLEIVDTGGEFSDLRDRIDGIAADPELLAMIGPLSSSLALAASVELQDKDITLLSPTASERGIRDIGGNIFSLNFVDESLAVRIAEFAVRDLGLSDFAAIFPMDDYGNRMVHAFIGRVEELGGRVLVAQGYPISATTFDVELKRIRYYSPEAIFIPAHSEEIPMIAPQIPFYGMENVQLLGTNGWNNRRVARLGGEYVEGAYFADTFFEKSSRLAYPEFSRRYEEVYQEEASRVAGLGYDALNLIAWGLEGGNRIRGRRAIDFSSLLNFKGATAVYSMGENGHLRKEPLLLTISGGKVQTVEESPEREETRGVDPTAVPYGQPLEIP